MSSMPECKVCGNFIHHGFVICQDCLEMHDEKIRQDATEKVLGEVRKTIDGGLPDMEHTLNRIFEYLRKKDGENG